MNRRHTAAAAFALLLLSACGGGGGDSGDTGAADNTGYLPLATGNRWVFDDGTESRVTGQRDVAGQRWWVMQNIETGGTTEALVRKDAQGVYAPFESPQFGTLQYPLIKLPVVAGATYALYSYRLPGFFDYDGNGTADDVDVTAEGGPIGFETVTTPAGTFSNALRIRVSGTSTAVYRPSGATALLLSGTRDTWYADGIGPVKGSLVETLATTGAVTTTSYLLTGYQVGTRTGGTLPPR
jgi:hypothetical protein